MKTYLITTLTLLLLASGVQIGMALTPAPERIVITHEHTSALKGVNAKAVAKELLTPSSYKCWLGLTMLESHMDRFAKNPTSSARGIGQLLHSTYSSLGMKFSTNEFTQLVAQLSYINRHFGGQAICSAYRYERLHHSY